MARGYTRHDWTKLDPLIDRLVKEEGSTVEQACKDLGIKISTYRMHERTREPATPSPDDSESAHPSTRESTDSTEVHQSAPEHQGTLEGYQEVMEDVQHSIPETPHISTEEVDQSIPEHQSVPQQLNIPEEAHPSIPEVHQEMSLTHSGVLEVHQSVPAHRDAHMSIPTGHPGTPTEEDWELWTIIKARWSEVEKMLGDRQALLSTPSGTPGHTQKKTYVFDVRHIEIGRASC